MAVARRSTAREYRILSHLGTQAGHLLLVSSTPVSADDGTGVQDLLVSLLTFLWPNLLSAPQGFVPVPGLLPMGGPPALFSQLCCL